MRCYNAVIYLRNWIWNCSLSCSDGAARMVFYVAMEEAL
jgi:hypothetical protein